MLQPSIDLTRKPCRGTILSLGSYLCAAEPGLMDQLTESPHTPVKFIRPQAPQQLEMLPTTRFCVRCQEQLETPA
jgi:hypothetical protein